MTEITAENPQTLEEVPFLILAGGKGTRLGDLTKDVPKPLVDIGGEPFIAHVLRLLKREGVKKVILLTHHLADQIEDFIQDGSKFGLEAAYIKDGPEALGTGAAVKQGLSKVEDCFAVMYADTYLDISMAPVLAAFKSSGLSAMMTVLENANQWLPSNVEYDDENGKIVKYDKKKNTSKMHFLDYGLSFFSKPAFEKHCKSLNNTAFDLGDVFQSMAKKSELAGYAVNRRFYDVSTVESLIETRAYLSQNQLWQIDSSGRAT
ncbi:MAG: NTP transferase domain-containing protein [Candidatus Melainabacteria bacterium]|nr:NTP transferase domain-containing protein [Candidatus Melainabacteria bacterium]